jgi:alpha-tubulin suppressor-like RCC1 family protein
MTHTHIFNRLIINGVQILSLLLFFSTAIFAQCWQSPGGGGLQMCALRTDGSLWAWGWNAFGQLGDGTNTDRNIPTRIGAANDWKSVSMGTHTVALKTDGSLWAWGQNNKGQLGDGTNIDKNSPIRIGTANDWQSISVGLIHNTFAIKTDGSLWAWGWNDRGQLGDGTNTDKSIPTRIGTANDWKSISAGSFCTVALKTDGSIWAWGLNDKGQLGDGTNTDKSIPTRIGTANDWKSISLSDSHVVALKTDGSLWAWGANPFGQLGDGTTTNKNIPTQIGTANDWQIVSAGYWHNAAIKTDGSLWAWGQNLFGQFGNGTDTDKKIPTRIGSANDWQIISAGRANTSAIKTDGSLWISGDNQDGQLGDGTNVIYRTTFTLVACPIIATEYAEADKYTVELYPNPITSQATLVVDDTDIENATVSISNALGQTIFSQALLQKTSTISLQNQAAGIYFVKIKTEKGEIVRKIQKL